MGKVINLNENTDLSEVRYYIIKPNLRLFGGLKINSDTKFDTYNDDKTVHQTLDNLILTTEIKRESTYTDDAGREFVSKEESKLLSTVPEGTVLIWREEQGYVILGADMVTVDEGLAALEQLKGITDPIENK